MVPTDWGETMHLCRKGVGWGLTPMVPVSCMCMAPIGTEGDAAVEGVHAFRVKGTDWPAGRAMTPMLQTTSVWKAPIGVGVGALTTKVPTPCQCKAWIGADGGR